MSYRYTRTIAFFAGQRFFNIGEHYLPEPFEAAREGSVFRLAYAASQTGNALPGDGLHLFDVEHDQPMSMFEGGHKVGATILIQDFALPLGRSFNFRCGATAGTIEIMYFSLDELWGIG